MWNTIIFTSCTKYKKNETELGTISLKFLSIFPLRLNDMARNTLTNLLLIVAITMIDAYIVSAINADRGLFELIFTIHASIKIKNGNSIVYLFIFWISEQQWIFSKYLFDIIMIRFKNVATTPQYYSRLNIFFLDASIQM